MERTSRALTAGTLLLLAAASALPNAAAHGEDMHGDYTIIHAEVVWRCDDVYLLGEDFEAASGHFTLWAEREGVAPPERIDEGTFEATPEDDGDGYTFRLGPYNLPEMGNESAFDFAITFQDQDEVVHEIHVAFDGSCDGASLPQCDAEAVWAVMNDDGTIELNWNGPAEHIEVYRDGELIANLTGETRTYIDMDTEPGLTYAYEVVLYHGTTPSERGCIEVTAVPFFGAPILGAVAAIGAVGAYAVLRRK